MQIMIDIPKWLHKKIIESTSIRLGDVYTDKLLKSIKNGTPLPKNHGRLIDADYVINHICESKECYKENCKGKLYMRCMDIMWVDDAPTIIERNKS